MDRYEITNTSIMIQIVSHVLAYMNSCVNPILYAFLSENFRKAFRKVIYCGPEGAPHLHHINGRNDAEKSAVSTKTTRSTNII
ncbi:unnamed protein product [Nezara viridula]|uniref:Uncharacterized protein n=1 Tax=Nezara viridula TaxID=85310 RepID=A0A9P0EB57_NEZVI|nr:unnamed protein product [Nezara viridula]